MPIAVAVRKFWNSSSSAPAYSLCTVVRQEPAALEAAGVEGEAHAVGRLEAGVEVERPGVSRCEGRCDLEPDALHDNDQRPDLPFHCGAQFQHEVGRLRGRHRNAHVDLVDRHRAERQMRMRRHLEAAAARKAQPMRPRPFERERQVEPRLAVAQQRMQERIARARCEHQREPLELRRKHGVERAVDRARAEAERCAFQLDARCLRRAEQKRRRLGPEVQSGADARGWRLGPGLERILHADAAWPDQHAYRRCDVRAGLHVERNAAAERKRQRDLGRHARLDHDPGQLAAARRQLVQHERGFDVLIGDPGRVERHDERRAVRRCRARRHACPCAHGAAPGKLGAYRYRECRENGRQMVDDAIAIELRRSPPIDARRNASRVAHDLRDLLPLEMRTHERRPAVRRRHALDLDDTECR